MCFLVFLYDMYLTLNTHKLLSLNICIPSWQWKSNIPLIEYSKTINSAASLNCCCHQQKIIYNAGEYYKSFVTYSAKAVERAEWKKINKWKTKTKLWSNGTSKEENVIRKKKGRQGLLRINLNYKRREQKSTFNHGFSKELRFIKQTRRKFNALVLWLSIHSSTL